MPKVSINILTKNRFELLKKALDSVRAQSFIDIEVVIVNDGSTDATSEYLRISNDKIQMSNKFQIINHQISKGITQSRQEALLASAGEYIAVLDDDDEWIDPNKLKKQVEFLERNRDYVLVGGAIEISNDTFQMTNQIQNPKSKIIRHRVLSDSVIRNTMLFRNNFFTSTVMFRKETAVKAGGFIKDEIDLAEDYDLWLRMGKLGKMANFKEVFALYRQSNYNKVRFGQFLQKQLQLIKRQRFDYPYYFFAKIFLEIRYGLSI